MSFFKRLFSAPDAVSKGMDAVISTGDALFFTDEEKSQANLKVLELRLKAAEATHGSRLARRILAIMFVGVYLFWASVAFVLMILAAYQCEPSLVDGVLVAGYCAPDVAQANVKELLMSAALGGSVIAIVSWYFFSGIQRVDK